MLQSVYIKLKINIKGELIMGQKYTLFKASLEGLNDKPRWYTIITAYNYEQKVTNDLKRLAASPEFKDLIVDAFSGSKITEELYTVKSGEIKIKNANFFLATKQQKPQILTVFFAFVHYINMTIAAEIIP